MATMKIADATLAYEEAGSGAPPLLFVHGWSGNRSNFAPQLTHFASRHRVVAVDQLGHGSSDAPEREYTIEAASDELAHVFRQLGLDRAVVVQHSNDRLAFDFASRYPELVLALVLVDTPTLAGAGFDAAATDFLAGLESDHWQGAIRGFAEQLVFAPGMPDSAKDEAMAAILATPRRVLISSWRHFAAYRAEDALPAVRCPLLHIAGSMPADLDRLRAVCPQVETAEVRGHGHFIQLTAPDEANDILARFVARVADTAGAPR